MGCGHWLSGRAGPATVAALYGAASDRRQIRNAASARDDFVKVLTKLSQGGVRPIILAHSLGAWLAIETVRQLSLMGKGDVVCSIDQLALAAPDIDIDLLRQQLSATDRLSRPIVVLASKDDIALALSKKLAGSTATAGSLDIDDPRTR